MNFDFTKYHGTGNDFILIDDREAKFPESRSELIHDLCDRHFGIGADGLILLREEDGLLRMVYFNSDGNESSMCGNGGRCFVHFARQLGLFERMLEFEAIDGTHKGEVEQDGLVRLGMRGVSGIEQDGDAFLLDTGSPHYVLFTTGVADLDVKKEGAKVRYSDRFEEEGINVNFVEILSNRSLFVRTYERGVEDETLSCGTGVTAAALACLQKNGLKEKQEVSIETPGGNLSVSAFAGEGFFSEIELIGPAAQVFTGRFDIADLSSGRNV